MEENETADTVVDDNDDCDNGVGHGDEDNMDAHEGNKNDDVVSETGEHEYSDAKEELDKNLVGALNEMVQRLCFICRNFFKGRFDTEFDLSRVYGLQGALEGIGARVYHSSLVSLKQSTEDECPICQELSRNFEEMIGKTPEIQGREDNSMAIWCGVTTLEWGDLMGLTATFLLCDLHGMLLIFDTYMYTLNLFPAEELGLGPEFRDPALTTTNAISETSISLARSWLQSCQEHVQCRKWGHISISPPTRLVRIHRADGDTSSNITVKLIETKRLPPNTVCSYVTLSHRWGDVTMLNLVEANLNALQQDIPIHQLPSLFRDAFHIADQLGMEYIWIDCLCIMQGSKVDWAHEAMRMGDYYRFAEFNLAASGYRDSSIGLAGERQALSFSNFPIQMDLLLAVGPQDKRRYRGFYVAVDELEFFNTISTGPLNSRGWVAQERALSPGVLHFTPKQMWWECSEVLVNEVFPTHTMSWGKESTGAGAIRWLSAETEREWIYHLWHKFIELYAGSELTVETDRFPAAIGIANVYAQLLDDNLVAGLWEGDIVHSLLWAANEKASNIPSVQLAPSWSWASVCVALNMGFRSETISGVSIQILSDIPGFQSDLYLPVLEISEVRGLSIIAPLRKIPPDMEGLSDRVNCVKEVVVRYDWEEMNLCRGHNVSHQQSWRWQDATHLAFLTAGYWEGSTAVTGLVLQQVAGKHNLNTFRRLGLVVFYVQPGMSDAFLGVGKHVGRSRPNIVFEECGLQDFIFI